MSAVDLFYQPGTAPVECLKSIGNELENFGAALESSRPIPATGYPALTARLHALNALRFEPQCHLPGCPCNDNDATGVRS